MRWGKNMYFQKVCTYMYMSRDIGGEEVMKELRWHLPQSTEGLRSYLWLSSFTESPKWREVFSHGFRLRQDGNLIKPVLLLEGWFKNKRPKFQLVPNYGESYLHKAPICQCKSGNWTLNYPICTHKWGVCLQRNQSLLLKLWPQATKSHAFVNRKIG